MASAAPEDLIRLRRESVTGGIITRRRIAKLQPAGTGTRPFGRGAVKTKMVVVQDRLAVGLSKAREETHRGGISAKAA